MKLIIATQYNFFEPTEIVTIIRSLVEASDFPLDDDAANILMSDKEVKLIVNKSNGKQIVTKIDIVEDETEN